MTLKLHLGVIDVPYVEKESDAKRATRLGKHAGKPRVKPKPSAPEHKTTGDVATILEKEYKVMNTFFETHELDIAKDLEGSLEGVLETMLLGGPPSLDPFGAATTKIEERFKDFLSTREAERVGIPGTPTEAARKGVNHRLKHPYAKANPRRPSFIDTGTYQASMKAWVE